MMPDNIIQMINTLQKEYNLDMLDIHQVKKWALERKMYDLIVYINNNLSDYVLFVRKIKEK